MAEIAESAAVADVAEMTEMAGIAEMAELAEMAERAELAEGRRGRDGCDSWLRLMLLVVDCLRWRRHTHFSGSAKNRHNGRRLSLMAAAPWLQQPRPQVALTRWFAQCRNHACQTHPYTTEHTYAHAPRQIDIKRTVTHT